jgi:predicted nucleic acid-binding protein
MGYLIDTNVLSELRKGNRGHPRLVAWSSRMRQRDLYLSVMVLGGVRCGIESLRGRDPAQSAKLEEWMDRVYAAFAGQILPVTQEIAERWGRLSATGPLGEVDGLLAATAIEHGIVVVTRNVRDFARTGVSLLNPFE